MRSGLRSLITLAVCFPAVVGLALMLSVPTVARAQEPPVNAFLVGSWDQYSGTYADIWGDGDYAYLPNFFPSGNQTARVHILDISDPSSPSLATTFFIPAPNQSRSPQDVKVGDGLLFIALSGTGSDGVAIVDVRVPTSPSLLATVQLNGYESVHNLFYDSGFLYLADGTTSRVGILDLTGFDPDNPPPSPITEATWILTGVGTSIVHDITVHAGRLYAAAWNSGLWVYDVSDVANTIPTLLGSVDGTSTHSVWPTADGKFVVVGEERTNGGILVYEVTDSGDGGIDFTLRDSLILFADAFSVHNPVVVGNRVYCSWYQAGLQVFDINPDTGLLEFRASYDTSPLGNNATFAGNWGVYPFLGSDRVLLSDMQQGMFVVFTLPDDCTPGPDCNGNSIPDQCEPLADCNQNGIFDACDIDLGTSQDCNANGIPDECDIASAASTDCNTNGVPDECEDCNGNGSADECDISSGTSDDTDTDGVPDECQASVLFVNANGGLMRGGTSWANAFTELVDALAVASNPANAVSEIWVAAGTYKPDKGSGDRSASFVLYSGVAVYGGFAGTETLLTERDPAVNLTILNGDIGTPADASDNTYQVVDASGTDATAVLDGVVIRNGNADGATPLNRGGGLHIDNGTPTILNCTFEDNHAGARGGALYNEFGTGATVSGCVFEGNTSGVGGAVYVRQSSPLLANCAFRSNSATVRGGAMHVIFNAAPVLVNCTFAGNTSPLGGALSNNSGTTVANCTFTQNVASNQGGAVFQTGGGASLTLENSVLWNNSDASGTDESGQLTIANGSSTVRYSCIQNYSGAGTNGNISSDPLFEDADGADNTAGTADDDLRLQPGSPAIDAADNSAVPVGVTTDLDGIPRFVDDPETADSGNGTPPIVDMGAHEYPGCSSTCGDINGSGGIVDLVDFASFAVCFNALPSSSAACACSDLNLDGAINLLDFATLSLIFNRSSTNTLPNCP